MTLADKLFARQTTHLQTRERSISSERGLPATLNEAVRLVKGLEQRFGAVLLIGPALFTDLTGVGDESRQHAAIAKVARDVENASRHRPRQAD